MSGLLVPYLGTSLILIVLMVFRTIFDGGLVVETVRSWTVAALYGSGAVLDSMPEGVMAIGAIWFLLALFWSRLLLNAALKTDYPAWYASPSLSLALVLRTPSGCPWLFSPQCAPFCSYILGSRSRNRLF